MKQVYQTASGLHWASNGSRVGGAFLVLRTYTDSKSGSRTFLERCRTGDVRMEDVEVEVVPCPKNRCKKCGAKQ